MDTDRRRSSKSKRYELGYHLAIDWYKLIMAITLALSLDLASSVDALAYQNNTSSNNDVTIDFKLNSSTQINLMNAILSATNDTKSPTLQSTTLRNAFESTPYTNIYKIKKKSYRNMDFSRVLTTEKITTVKDDLTVLSDTSTRIGIENHETTKSYYDGDIEMTTTYLESEAIETSTTNVQDNSDEVTTYHYSADEKLGAVESGTVTEDASVVSTTEAVSNLATDNSLLFETTVNIDLHSETIKTKRLSTFSSTTLKNIVHQIQEQVNKSLNDSLYSSENVIEDSYSYINDSGKKINGTDGIKLRQNSIQKKVNLVGSTNCTNCTDKIGAKVVEVKNRTKASNSSKSNLEDDYNTSYEMEEYDEDAFNMKKSVTEAPSSGPFDAIRDFAGSVVESLYDTYMPQGIRDLFRRMQEQNEKLEVIRLRSKEENGGIGQFGRNLLKGITIPINQLMRGVRDYGSLDSDKNFFAGVASGVVSMADSVGDSFKDRVKAIFPGTLWCGDGDMARSAEVGLFFMTDSCCRRHDACKLYILSGETKYGLTNTGLFTRSHCDCDKAFYRCLKRTNSVVSSQIGLTYFSILGPQCFKREHPIMRCKRRTRITSQKCEEYQMDYNQSKMWQWFDNETF
ncbi:uncharacterized protein LOC143909285 [Arctopsyche grandis]|uniref:uncharacterized protein LOC143909285 n=1 Tax=Arctopsyche grandis TaxID=121162 RepID=UPI00406D800D